MVEILLDRADSGSVANILVGDMIVVRVHDTDARRWAVEDAGYSIDENAVQKDGSVKLSVSKWG